MKKLLLLSLFIFPLFSNAQVLITENFNSLNVGNISNEITGAVAGQGSYYLFSSNGTPPTTTSNAGVSNAQIVSTGNASQGILLEGPNGDLGSRFVWKDGLPALWSSRTSMNQIIELEVDINPGAGTSTSRNTFGAYIFNAAGDKVLAGFTVRAATRELFLVAYSTPTGNPVGNYSYSLAAAPGIQLPANTFSRVGISYNVTTRLVTIKGPGLATGATVTGSATATDPAEVDFIAFSGNTTAAPNSASATMVMDNLTIKATGTDSLLDNTTFDNVITSFSVSPNPANDFITISNSENVLVNAISITDLNGRVVKQNSFTDVTNVQVNISDLSSGVYMMNITTDKGSVTKKIIKN